MNIATVNDFPTIVVHLTLHKCGIQLIDKTYVHKM